MERTITEAVSGLTLDPWQQKVLEYEGNICIRAGRQVGKSTVIAIKAHDFAKNHPGTVTLVIAASQRQSAYLFGKIRSLFDEDSETKKVYKENPTQTKIELLNGSKIYCLPTGKTGMYIRGYTVDLLIADEAAYIPEKVWLSIMPMIAVSRQQRKLGWLILLSTPFGKGGFFYDCFGDKDFKQFHVSSETCDRIPKEFLLKEKRRLSKIEYAQEYLAEFVEEWNQFFSTALVKACTTFIEWDFETEYDVTKNYFLGVDVARYGGDENAFCIAELAEDKVKIVKATTTNRVSLTDTIGRIKALDEKFKFRKIFIDDAGVGGGVYDILSEEIGHKVVGLNNAKRSVDKDGSRRRILKEDLYSNAQILMESFVANRKPNVEIISDVALIHSLKSTTFEYTKDKFLRIYGINSHLTEAFVRACWCLKEKGLKLFIA